MWDERLTSVEANRMLKTAGLSINKRQQAVDRVSAVLLLQNYLDHHASQLEQADSHGGSL
jgi:putative pre-16S rRNA nuclease